ncbi:MAG: hypothetical protein MI919_04820 [Holophagales bacterium]|nr:hypothetical protein [Holophagales bacterium]
MSPSPYAQRMSAFDGRSVEPFRAIADELVGKAEAISEMLGLARSSHEPAVAIGTTWIVKDLLERGADPPEGLAGAVIELLGAVEPADARLHLLQCLPLAPISASEARRLEPLLSPLLEDRNTFVRAWAYNALGLAAEAEPALRETVLERLERAAKSEKASVRVRIRKARERLLGG